MAGAHRPGVTAIPLGRPSPGASSNQPERQGQRMQAPRRLRAPRIAPIRFCSRRGLPCRRRCRLRGALLPHPFTLAVTLSGPCGPRPGGLLSVALSLGFPPPDVIRRRIRMEPGLSSASQRRPSGRLAWQGICGRSDGGQGQSDENRRAGGTRAGACSFEALHELWDCGGGRETDSLRRLVRA